MRAKHILGLGAVLLIATEIRGIILAAPILWAMAVNGGTWMQVWILLCIALSTLIPITIYRKMRKKNG